MVKKNGINFYNISIYYKYQMDDFSYESKTDESMINIPKRYIQKMIDENKAKNTFNENKLNILENKIENNEHGVRKISKDKLINDVNTIKKMFDDNSDSLKGGNKEEIQIRNDDNVSSHSIFVKFKTDSNGSENNNKKHTSNNTIEGGNIKGDFLTETQRHTTFNNEKKIENKTTLFESSNNSSYSDDDTSSDYSSSNTYYTTETEDGLNEAYNKINKQLSNISKKQKGGEMNNKQVIKKINLLLNSVRILNDVKNKK